MKQLDELEFEQLIADKKYDEAKAKLRQFFESELSDEEDGEVYVTAMAEYLSVSNAINEAYLIDMKDLKEKLNKIEGIEENIKKDIDTNKIRDDIQNL